ncbi:hypothetical protein F5Y19DRAFT_451755 [Xylariaceae sp. FL1651]|nr:hypothetical protein F5Y19DRAFT_451755 [Xylariaceae sp. FL1651]
MSATQPLQQVSGQSVFWALITLATATMTQPSTNSNRRRDLYNGKIDLLRSIPGICLLDGVVDLIILSRARSQKYSKPSISEPKVRLKHDDILAMLIIYIFAILAQTIKVFTMRGIPATQFCASLFLFAATTRLIIELSGIETDEHRSGEEADVLRRPIVLSTVLVTYGHIFLVVWIWSNIGLSATFYLSHNAAYFHRGLLVIFFSLSFLSLMSMAVLDIMRPRRESSPSNFGIALLTWGLGAAEKQPDTPRDERVSRISPPKSIGILQINRGMSLMACAIVVSIVTIRASNAIAYLIAWREDLRAAIRVNPRAKTRSKSAQVSPFEQEAKPSDAINEPGSGLWAESRKVVLGWTLELCIKFQKGMRKIDLLSNLELTEEILAFTIVNLITTVCYYLIYFDGTGTTSPAWTTYLG